MTLTTTSDRKHEEHTFADMVKGRENEFPILARAAENTFPASSVKIEWIVDGPAIQENWQQIFRHPYNAPVEQGSKDRGGSTSKEDATTRFLASVEQTLEYGVPSYDYIKSGGMPVSTCGGFRHYLNRGLLPDDVLILRPLREPVLLTIEIDRYGVPLDNPTYEWLCETSLTVIPAKES